MKILLYLLHGNNDDIKTTLFSYCISQTFWFQIEFEIFLIQLMDSGGFYIK